MRVRSRWEVLWIAVILWLGVLEAQANQPSTTLPARKASSPKAEAAKQKLQQIIREEEQAQVLMEVYQKQVFLLPDGRTIRRNKKNYPAPFFLLMPLEYNVFFRETPRAKTFARWAVGVDITGRIFLGLAAGSALSISILAFAMPQTLAPPSGNVFDSPAFWIGSAGGVCLLLGISLVAAVPAIYGTAISTHNHRIFAEHYRRLTKQKFPHHLEPPDQPPPNIQPMRPPAERALPLSTDRGRFFLYELR